MNINELLNDLEKTGKTFHVSFTKADGSEREMDCRMGVKKHTKGGVATYNMNNAGNIGVYESIRNDKGQFSEGAYKCFNINRVKSIKVGGKLYKFS